MRGNNCFVKRCHALGRITRAILVLATLASAARPVPGGSVVHVAPGGNDRNPGTATAPVVTLARAYERVKDSPQPREIVIHEGVYVGGVQLGRREDRLGGPRPHILIRAANRSDGSFERVVFDGARKIDAATIVPGAPGVFRIAKPDQYSPGRPPQMWESESRKRYTLVADLAAVRHYPASYWVGDEDIYFHTSDGRPPQDHEVGLSWHSNGISLWRTDMTLRGIEFRNCLTWSYSCGAGLFAARAAIEDCRAWNTVRGFYSWGGVPGGRIVRCRTDDVGTGVFCQGIGTQVEDCRLFKLRDDFLVPCHEQDDCGIHYYSPAEDGEIRGNLIVGFREGILLKCRSQKFRVEHNTCVGFTTIGLGSLAYHPEGVYRLNICVGPGTPLAFIDGLKSTTVMDYNLAWGYNNRFMPQTLRKSFAKTGTGASTIFADPRFAAPSLGDYRLLPSSPAVAKGPNGETLGALGVAGLGFQDKEPPTVSLALEKPARHESDSGNLWVPECAWLGGANALARTEKLRCPEWLSPGRPIALAIKAADNLGQIRQMRVQVGNGPWGPAEPFQTGMKLTLPEAWQFGPVRVQVCDAAGNWSEPATALVRVASALSQLNCRVDRL
jgi:hypothetical protein